MRTICLQNYVVIKPVRSENLYLFLQSLSGEPPAGPEVCDTSEIVRDSSSPITIINSETAQQMVSAHEKPFA
jgi:hypothetical protein